MQAFRSFNFIDNFPLTDSQLHQFRDQVAFRSLSPTSVPDDHLLHVSKSFLPEEDWTDIESIEGNDLYTCKSLLRSSSLKVRETIVLKKLCSASSENIRYISDERVIFSNCCAAVFEERRIFEKLQLNHLSSINKIV